MKRSRILALIIFLNISLVCAAPRWLNLYIPEFDNIRNDPSVAWLSSGFVDVLSKKFREIDGVRIYGRSSLEKILQDKSSFLVQRPGTENILIMATFTRQLDQINVTAQLINVANWDELGSVRLVGSMNNISNFGDDLYSSISEKIKDRIPPSPKVGELQNLVGHSDSPELNRQTKEVGSSLNKALSGLEKAMDQYIGARGVPEATVSSKGKYSRQLNFGTKKLASEPLTKESMMLEEILETIANNPYSVVIDEPNIEVDPKSKGKTVFLTIPIKYSLKENLIGDLLRSLPYTGVKHDGTLTSVEFARNKFPISESLNHRITKGHYRVVPVVQLRNQSGDVHTSIIDTGDPHWNQESSLLSNTIVENIFSPLVAFTLSGWSLQVTMEAVDISANYSIEMTRSEVGQLSEIVVEFVPESNLKSFLKTAF
tara:strand:- start:13286 stop:14569 length:1284 start_codon:yes stop_codon:yes gene_type:complete